MKMIEDYATLIFLVPFVIVTEFRKWIEENRTSWK